MNENGIKSKPLGIPYGMMNFVAIREDNYYYVDKTRFIEKIENSNRYFFFTRPRRFGKSLTMSIYLNSKATDAQVASTIEQAKAQVCRYADTVNAKEQIGTTTLHKVYVVYRGVEMVACEEVVE